MQLDLAALRSMFADALPNVLEGVVAPIVLFYLGFGLFGLWGALAAGLAWSYGGVVRRLLRRQPVPGLVILSAIALTARTAVSAATGSLFIYFLQPTLGTFGAAGVFLVSAALGRPMTERLSADLVRLPELVTDHPAMRQLHVRLTVLWALVFVANGALALWLLVSQPAVAFLLLKTVGNGTLVVVGIGASVVAFRRCLRRHGLASASA